MPGNADDWRVKRQLHIRQGFTLTGIMGSQGTSVVDCGIDKRQDGAVNGQRTDEWRGTGRYPCLQRPAHR